MNAVFEKKIPIPMEIKKEYPPTDKIIEIWKDRDKQIKGILTGNIDKLILIIGPCSADNPKSVMEYIYRLKLIQEEVQDKIFIVPRIYTNKPRTTGEGYKGLLHQPDPSGKTDFYNGIVESRKLHLQAILETGFTCADEMLYPENHKYFDDLIGYVTVGARSAENQQHRLTASAIEVPVGMKNPTSGNLSIMLNSINAAQHTHTFLYRGWQVSSNGNPFAHAVLRGSVDNNGNSTPNYMFNSLLSFARKYTMSNLKNAACIIDTNHDNSGKNYLKQPDIVYDVMDSMKKSNEIKKIIKGFMIESYLQDGSQKIGNGEYGKSITDPCLGWDKTQKLILSIADRI